MRIREPYIVGMEQPLGSVSAQFESQRNSAAIGYDEGGGTSYGRYQFASNRPTLANFIRWARGIPEYRFIAAELSSVGRANTGSTSGDMPTVWRRLATDERTRDIFSRAEREFALEEYWFDALAPLRTRHPDIANFIVGTPAAAETFFSTSVQNGPGAARRFFRDAWNDGAIGTNESARDTQRNILNRIYDLRGSRDQFRSQSDEIFAGIQNRFRQEREAILNLYDRTTPSSYFPVRHTESGTVWSPARIPDYRERAQRYSETGPPQERAPTRRPLPSESPEERVSRAGGILGAGARALAAAPMTLAAAPFIAAGGAVRETQREGIPNMLNYFSERVNRREERIRRHDIIRDVLARAGLDRAPPELRNQVIPTGDALLDLYEQGAGSLNRPAQSYNFREALDTRYQPLGVAVDLAEPMVRSAAQGARSLVGTAADNVRALLRPEFRSRPTSPSTIASPQMRRPSVPVESIMPYNEPSMVVPQTRPSYAQGGYVGPSGQPVVPAGLSTASAPPEMGMDITPEQIDMTVNQAMQNNPQMVEQVRMAIMEAMQTGELTMQELNTLGQMAQAAMQDPNLYPQLRQMAIREGLAGEEDIPPQFDPALISVMLVAIRSMRGVEGMQAPQAPQSFAMGGAVIPISKANSVDKRHDDPVIAELEQGEYVIPKKIVQMKGQEFFDNMLKKYSPEGTSKRV